MLSASLPGLDVCSGDAATSQTGSFPSQKLAVPRGCPVGLSSLHHACAASVCSHHATTAAGDLDARVPELSLQRMGVEDVSTVTIDNTAPVNTGVHAHAPGDSVTLECLPVRGSIQAHQRGQYCL